MPSAPEPRPRLVTGLQPVREAIRVHGSRLTRLVVEDRDVPRLEAVARFARDQGVTDVRRLPRRDLDRLAEGAQHQGVLALAPELELHDLDELLDDPELVALALDGIEDPQNFGAVIRSAVGIAGAAVIWGEHSSAPLTPATFRASAGAIEHARLCRVRSLATALEQAKATGMLVIGLEAQAEQELRDLDLSGRVLLVIGSEGEGMARAVRRACDVRVSLLSMQRLDSLNASVAAGIALYEVTRQRRRA
ncbi:MAG: RNA methyltransferase [Polyangiaceae bacterium]